MLTVFGGAALLGLNCGLLGSLLVVRRMTMLADTLSHAVLPGVAIGFLLTMTRNPAAVLAGALATGVLSSLVVNWITSTTRLKPDGALSVVLTVFFALGIVLIRLVPDAKRTGLDRFLYGQAAALDGQDVQMLAITAGISGLAVLLCHRGWLVLAFDETFGRAAGLPMRALHMLQMFLTTLAIVFSMQAVGVILVAGMLAIPASTAWLLSQRMQRLILWSTGLGVLAALGGTALSFFGSAGAAESGQRGGFPMGPSIVLCSSAIFAAVLFLAPRRGLLARALEKRSRTRQVARENTLKAAWRAMEEGEFRSPDIPLRELAQRRSAPESAARTEVAELVRAGLAGMPPGRDTFTLTERGFAEAARIVRNHRLWELYLTTRAGYPQDHVHDDAEEMEHLLAEEHISHLQHVLGDPLTDPHGSLIPDPAVPRSALAGRAGRSTGPVPPP